MIPAIEQLVGNTIQRLQPMPATMPRRLQVQSTPQNKNAASRGNQTRDETRSGRAPSSAISRKSTEGGRNYLAHRHGDFSDAVRCRRLNFRRLIRWLERLFCAWLR